MKPTDALDIVGVTSLAVFAGLVWVPLCLLVIGLAALAMSWQASQKRGSR